MSDFYVNKIASLYAMISFADSERRRISNLNGKSYSSFLISAIGNIDAYIAEKTAEVEKIEKLLDECEESETA